MTLPGSTVISRDTPPPRSAPTNTGVWHVAGLTERGPAYPVRITSLNQYMTYFGGRVSYGILYDALDVFFREGGAVAYVSRVLGPAAVIANAKAFDVAGSVDPGDVSLAVVAKDAGDWWNDVNLVIATSGAGRTYTVTHDTLGILEVSPELLTREAAVTWATSSRYVTLSLGASAELPRPQTVNLAAGADDRASVVDAHWDIALAKFAKDLGPGQVSFPGRTTAAAHTSLLTHAAGNHRVALLDAPDTAVVGTLTALAATARSNNPVNVKYGAMFAPWAIVPGVVPGTTRTVPYSAVQAGLIARSDGAGNSPNVAAAGSNGEARFVSGYSQAAWTDVQREQLNDAGVNVAREIYGAYKTYGYRSLVDGVANNSWLQFTAVRLEMYMKAIAAQVLEEFNFDEIDGQNKKFGELNGALTGAYLPLWQAGSLYGATAAEAFYVDTGPQVNTPESIEAGFINAEVSARMSPFGERTVFGISKVPTSQEL